MADTQRTIADLLTNLFQDGQAAGSIVEQDMRDLIVSLVTEHGGLYVSSSSATTIGVAGTFVKVAGTTTITPGSSSGITMPSDNRLTYDAAAAGLPTRHFTIDTEMSMTSAGNNQDVRFAIAKNGTVITGSDIARKIGTGADVGAMGLAWNVELASTDFVEIWCTNDTSTSTITATKMVTSAFAHIQ
jgi:hypothetical protein